MTGEKWSLPVTDRRRNVLLASLLGRCLIFENICARAVSVGHLLSLGCETENCSCRAGRGLHWRDDRGVRWVCGH